MIFQSTRIRHIAQTMTALAALLMAGCSGGTHNSGTTENIQKRQITVSVPPLSYIAKAIGGDSIEVNTLLAIGTDPETFQPGMDAMRSLQRSGFIAVTGVLPFEREMIEKLSTNNPDMRVADLSAGISLIYGTHSHNHEAEEHVGHHHSDTEADPHIWGSVKNIRTMATNLLGHLSTLYPDLKPYLIKRCDSLVAHLDSIDTDFGNRLNHKPAFVIWHPSLSYLARDYGLNQIAFNLENKETSPRQLKEATDKAMELSPVAFFVPQGLNPERTSAIASALGMKPVEINFLSADCEKELNAIVDHLTSVGE